MTKRQLVKWLEAKQSDAKAEVEIQYATAEKSYFAQRDETLLRIIRGCKYVIL